MKQLNKVNGQCLCGAVTFVIDGPISSFHICYCSRCRHSSGSAHASNLFSQPTSITWLSGEEYLQRFELPTARSWAKQFCKQCGSGVPYINRSATFLVIPAGSLNDEIPLTPDDRIFCDDRCGWVTAIAESPEFAGLPNTF